MSTYKPFLNSKPKTDGTYTIIIRITSNRKHKYVSTNHSIKKADWNKEAKNGKFVRTSHPLHKVINSDIESVINKLKTIASSLDEEDATLLKKVLKGDKPQCFFSFAKRNLENLKAKKKIATYKKRKSVLSELEDYCGGRELLFKDITSTFLEDYENYLHTSTQNKVNTINTKFRTIRAILYDGINKGLLPQEKNPFYKFKLSREKSNKDRLNSVEIKALEELVLEPNTKLWNVRNYFLFSFYNYGIRFSDFVTLVWDNITGERLTYIMKKTNMQRNLILHPKSQNLLAMYRDNNSLSTKYIFPILPNNFDDLSIEKRFNLISSKNALINKWLKELATAAKIKKKLSFHIARHSFATIARDKGENVALIQRALGHSSIQITEAYLDSMRDEDLDNLSQSMYD